MTASIFDYAAIRKRLAQLEGPQPEIENAISWPPCELVPESDGVWKVTFQSLPTPAHREAFLWMTIDATPRFAPWTGE